MEKMTPALEKLMVAIDDLHKSPMWEEIKPDGLDPRASEYIAQGHADLVRCMGNLERAGKVMGE